MCSAGDQEVRNKAYAVCRDYLHGAWQLITPDDMQFRPITGGLSNLLFFCELPSNRPPLGEEPSRVLLRMYGQVRDGAHEATITESVIFTLLAERKLGPKLYGIFPGGRLEEFMQAAALSTDELRVAPISEQIAFRLAQVHNLKVPISKEPVFLWQTMKKWSQLSHKCLSDATLANNVGKSNIILQLRKCNFEHEIEWLRQFFDKYPSPVVFCHNDCQEGNILKHMPPSSGTGAQTTSSSGQPLLTLIDFEYCSYNYRGFDLANHFCEWMYDYSPANYPHFSCSPNHWPSLQEQLRFIRAYLAACDDGQLTPDSDSDMSLPHLSSSSSSRSSSNSVFTGDRTCESRTGRGEISPSPSERRILHEVVVYSLASHLFWTLWSVVNAPVSTITFGYWEYGLCRMEAYQHCKRQLVEAEAKKVNKTLPDSQLP